MQPRACNRSDCLATRFTRTTPEIGGQVVRLAFQSAGAEAEFIQAQQKAGDNNQPAQASTQMQALAQMQSKISAQIDHLQSQLKS